MSGAARPVRCLIVDGSTAYRNAAETILEAGGVTVVGSEQAEDDAIRTTAKDRPDVVLVAGKLAQANGFQLLIRLAALDHPPTVLLVTALDPGSFGWLVESRLVAGCLAKERLTAAVVAAAGLGAPGSGLDLGKRDPGDEGGPFPGWAGHDEAAS